MFTELQKYLPLKILELTFIDKFVCGFVYSCIATKLKINYALKERMFPSPKTVVCLV